MLSSSRGKFAFAMQHEVACDLVEAKNVTEGPEPSKEIPISTPCSTPKEYFESAVARASTS